MLSTTETDPRAADQTRLIAGLLGRLRTRIRGRFLIHGLGWMIAATAAIVLAYYALDRILQLPPVVRILFSLAIGGFLVLGLRRRVLYPMSRKFGLDDMAVAVERNFPELHEKLISALQFSELAPVALRNQSSGMIQRTLEQAATEVDSIPVQRVLNPRRTARVWAIAGAFALALMVTLAMSPAAASVFVRRVFGADLAYPRLTTLQVLLPEDGPDVKVVREGRARALVTVARGADLRIGVRAIGREPREVFLVSASERGPKREVSMSARGDGTFGHVFRRVEERFRFHASGGDDPAGDLSVEVTTISPPAVAGIVVQVVSPAYSGRAALELRGGPIEALEGSTVTLEVETTLPITGAELRLEEAGVKVPLVPAPPPVSGSNGGVDPRLAQRRLVTGSFKVERSDRYSVDLAGENGLHSVRPGTYPVLMTRDREPTVRVLTPRTTEDSVVLKTGILPLRVLAEDDFGVVALGMGHQLGQKSTESLRELEGQQAAGGDGEPPRPPEPRPPEPASRTALYHTSMVEVATLTSEEKPEVGEGDIITLRFVARDNKEPTAQSSNVQPLVINVVGEGDLQRRIAGQFRRVREDVEKLLAQQKERRERLSELVTALTEHPELSPAERVSVTALDAGQSRIASSVERVRDELMRGFDTHLFNRLDTSLHAPKIVERYLAFHRSQREPKSLFPGFYVELGSAIRSGEIGQLDMLGKLLDMCLAAHRVVDAHGPATTRALSLAGAASDAAAARQALQTAGAEQDKIIAELDGLLERLTEWNEFQDVLQGFRELIQRQKDVQSQTRSKIGGR